MSSPAIVVIVSAIKEKTPIGAKIIIFSTSLMTTSFKLSKKLSIGLDLDLPICIKEIPTIIETKTT